MAAVCEYTPPVENVVRPNKNIRLGGYFYAGTINAEWFAKNFDFLDLNAKSKPTLISEIRSFNPNIKIYQQFLTNQMSTVQDGAQSVDGFNIETMSEWLLLKSDGTPLGNSHRGNNYYFMDIAGSSGWADYFSKYTSNILSSTSTDGVVLDETPFFTWGFLSSSNTTFSDLQEYKNNTQIQYGSLNFIKYIKGFLNGRGKNVIIGGGSLHLKMGDNSNTLWSFFYPWVDGVWHESWVVRYWGVITDTTDSKHPSLSDWDADISYAGKFSADNKPFIASPEFSDRESLEYALANYLLAINGATLYFQPMIQYDSATRGGFNFSRVKDTVERNRDLIDLELGCATSSREQDTSGVWTRKYEKALILVNPENNTRTIRLNEKFTDISGSSVGDTVVMGPYAGKILLVKSTESTNPGSGGSTESGTGTGTGGSTESGTSTGTGDSTESGTGMGTGGSTESGTSTNNRTSSSGSASSSSGSSSSSSSTNNSSSPPVIATYGFSAGGITSDGSNENTNVAGDGNTDNHQEINNMTMIENTSSSFKAVLRFQNSSNVLISSSISGKVLVDEQKNSGDEIAVNSNEPILLHVSDLQAIKIYYNGELLSQSDLAKITDESGILLQ